MEVIEASVGAEAVIVPDDTHAAIKTPWTWMTLIAPQAGTTIVAVGVPVPDQDRLMMIDTIDLVVEAVEMMKRDHATVAHAGSEMEVESEPQALRERRANLQHLHLLRMSVTDVLYSCNSWQLG